MFNLSKLFGQSPFSAIQKHMEKVSECIHFLPSLFEEIKNGNKKEIQNISKKISKKEHEADLIKNDIRNHLPKSLFLPIDRGSILEILSLQDSLADKAEDIAVLSTLHEIKHYEILEKDFTEFWEKSLNAFELLHQVINEFKDLVESSFGGVEAQKVKSMTDEIAYKEHEIDKLQYKLLKKLFEHGDQMSYLNFHMWQSLLKAVSELSNLAEKLGNRVRMILDIK